MDSCIISLNLNCILQLKQFYNIATKVSCRKSATATTFGDLPDWCWYSSVEESTNSFVNILVILGDQKLAGGLCFVIVIQCNMLKSDCGFTSVMRRQHVITENIAHDQEWFISAKMGYHENQLWGSTPYVVKRLSFIYNQRFISSPVKMYTIKPLI